MSDPVAHYEQSFSLQNHRVLKNPYFQAKMPDFGRWQNMKDSFGMAYEVGLGNTLFRNGQYELAGYMDRNAMGTDAELGEEEFKTLYGDFLEWKPKITRSQAHLMAAWKSNTLGKMDRTVNRGDRSMIPDFMAGMAGSLAHPIDFGTMLFTPYMGVAGRVGKLSQFTVRNMFKATVNGTSAGAFDAAWQVPMMYMGNKRIQQEYTVENGLMDLTFSVGAGGTLGLGVFTAKSGLTFNSRSIEGARSSAVDTILRYRKEGDDPILKALVNDPSIKALDEAQSHLKVLKKALKSKDLEAEDARAIQARSEAIENILSVHGFDENLSRVDRAVNFASRKVGSAVSSATDKAVDFSNSAIDTIFASPDKSKNGRGARFVRKTASAATFIGEVGVRFTTKAGAKVASVSVKEIAQTLDEINYYVLERNRIGKAVKEGATELMPEALQKRLISLPATVKRMREFAQILGKDRVGDRAVNTLLELEAQAIKLVELIDPKYRKQLKDGLRTSSKLFSESTIRLTGGLLNYANVNVAYKLRILGNLGVDLTQVAGEAVAETRARRKAFREGVDSDSLEMPKRLNDQSQIDTALIQAEIDRLSDLRSRQLLDAEAKTTKDVQAELKSFLKLAKKKGEKLSNEDVAEAKRKLEQKLGSENKTQATTLIDTLLRLHKSEMDVRVKKADRKMVKEFFSRLGVDVRYKRLLRSDGLYDPKRPNQILLDTNPTTENIWFVAWHEFGHALRRQNPDAWNRIVDLAMESDFEGRSLAELALVDIQQKYGKRWATLDEAVQQEEWISNVIAWASRSPEFWRQLHTSNRGLFDRMVSFFKAFVDWLTRNSHTDFAEEWTPLIREIADALSEGIPGKQGELWAPHEMKYGPSPTLQRILDRLNKKHGATAKGYETLELVRNQLDLIDTQIFNDWVSDLGLVLGKGTPDGDWVPVKEGKRIKGYKLDGSKMHFRGWWNRHMGAWSRETISPKSRTYQFLKKLEKQIALAENKIKVQELRRVRIKEAEAEIRSIRKKAFKGKEGIGPREQELLDVIKHHKNKLDMFNNIRFWHGALQNRYIQTLRRETRQFPVFYTVGKDGTRTVATPTFSRYGLVNVKQPHIHGVEWYRYDGGDPVLREDKTQLAGPIEVETNSERAGVSSPESDLTTDQMVHLLSGGHTLNIDEFNNLVQPLKQEKARLWELIDENNEDPGAVDAIDIHNAFTRIAEINEHLSFWEDGLELPLYEKARSEEPLQRIGVQDADWAKKKLREWSRKSIRFISELEKRKGEETEKAVDRERKRIDRLDDKALKKEYLDKLAERHEKMHSHLKTAASRLGVDLEKLDSYSFFEIHELYRKAFLEKKISQIREAFSILYEETPSRTEIEPNTGEVLTAEKSNPFDTALDSDVLKAYFAMRGWEYNLEEPVNSIDLQDSVVYDFENRFDRGDEDLVDMGSDAFEGGTPEHIQDISSNDVLQMPKRFDDYEKRGRQLVKDVLAQLQKYKKSEDSNPETKKVDSSEPLEEELRALEKSKDADTGHNSEFIINRERELRENALTEEEVRFLDEEIRSGGRKLETDLEEPTLDTTSPTYGLTRLLSRNWKSRNRIADIVRNYLLFVEMVNEAHSFVGSKMGEGQLRELAISKAVGFFKRSLEEGGSTLGHNRQMDAERLFSEYTYHMYNRKGGAGPLEEYVLDPIRNFNEFKKLALNFDANIDQIELRQLWNDLAVVREDGGGAIDIMAFVTEWADRSVSKKNQKDILQHQIDASNRQRIFEAGDKAYEYQATQLDGLQRRGARNREVEPIESRKHGKINEHLVPFLEVLVRFDLHDHFTNNRLNDQWAKAMNGKDSGIPGLNEAAKLYKAILDNQMNEVNHLGGDQRALDGFLGFSQTHNRTRIQKAGFEAWSAKLMEWVDWGRTKASNGNMMLDADGKSVAFEPRAYLLALWDDIINGHVRDMVYDPENTGGDLARINSHRRSLHFKDEHGVAYDTEFGSGAPATAIIDGLVRRSEQIALMEAYGPNIREGWNSIINDLRLSGVDELKQKWLGVVFKQVAGDLDNPVDQDLAAKGQLVRMASNLANLGLSGISALSDMAGITARLKYDGVDVGLLDARLWKSISESYKRQRKGKNSPALLHYRAMGAGLDAWRNAVSRRLTGETPGHNALSKWNDRMFNWNFLNLITTIGQEVTMDFLSVGLARGEIDLDVLGQYGISPEEAGSLSGMAKAVEGLGPEKRVYPTLVERKNPELARKLRIYLDTAMREAVIEPDSGTQAMVRLGMKAGTVSGEGARVALQYTSFPLAITRKTYSRFLYGYGHDSFTEWFMDPRNRGKAHMLAFMATALTAGFVAANLKDIAKLREPVAFNMLHEGNWNRIAQQSGIRGILDFSIAPMPRNVYKTGTYILDGDLFDGGQAKVINKLFEMTPGATAPFYGEAMRGLLALTMGDALIGWSSWYQARADFIERKTGQSSLFQDNPAPESENN